MLQRRGRLVPLPSNRKDGPKLIFCDGKDSRAFRAFASQRMNERNAMPRPLIVSIPQQLGRQEARRRLDTGIARLTPELGVILSGLDYHWQNDTLHFTGTAMWQRITGRIEVLDDTVRIEVDLPWVMQLLADTIAKRVRSRAIALLDKPPDHV